MSMRLSPEPVIESAEDTVLHLSQTRYFQTLTIKAPDDECDGDLAMAFNISFYGEEDTTDASLSSSALIYLTGAQVDALERSIAKFRRKPVAPAVKLQLDKNAVTTVPLQGAGVDVTA